MAKESPGRQREPGPLFLGLAYAVLLLLGAVLGLVGAFLLYAGPRVGTVPVLPVGLVVALVTHPAAGWLGLRLAGTRLAAFTPMIGWLVVVLPAGVRSAEGDLILTDGARSLLYLAVGTLTYVLVGLVARPTRGGASAGPPRSAGTGRGPRARGAVATDASRSGGAGRSAPAMTVGRSGGRR